MPYVCCFKMFKVLHFSREDIYESIVDVTWGWAMGIGGLKTGLHN